MAAGADTPLIDIAGLRKNFGGLRPLRVNTLRVARGEHVTVQGLDAEAAEMLVLLVTGASVPDEGTVRIAGRDTREIATDTDWLVSLDLFGMVTSRAVLLDSLPLESNLALPLTLSIDPIAPDIRQQVRRLAAEAGLSDAALSQPVSQLSEADRLRVHLARALALHPQMLLLEHPTARLAPAESEAFGTQLRTIGERRALAWLALTEDEAFAGAAGGRRGRLVPGSGDVKAHRPAWRLW
jgi:ABC-type transporter Mla maintaining outer membrane lipid asymmetry ATPase subunit MlaF